MVPDETVATRTQVSPTDLGAGVEAAVLERILSYYSRSLAGTPSDTSPSPPNEVKESPRSASPTTDQACRPTCTNTSLPPGCG